MKNKKEVLAVRAAKARNELEKFLSENSFQSGNTSLKLSYNPYHTQNGAAPYTYTLQVGKNGSHVNFNIEEIKELIVFLNKIKLVE